MSGIEVAGLVLGAIPLLISAMEHFEETRKVARDWWKIRRAHRKDVGKLRDCEMKFQLNMRELLQPLLLDGTISEEEYATFLGSTSNSGWQRSDVQEALAERLSDCRDRYLEKLDEMNELLVRLAKATLVDDEKFQNGIKQRKGTANTSPQGIERFVSAANIHLAFELKRLDYTFSGDRRRDLIDELEACNQTLSQFLQANDRIAEQSGTANLSSVKRIKRKFKLLLSYWDHADCVFKLITKAWKCNCAVSHSARLWLPGCLTLRNWELKLLTSYSSHSQEEAKTSWADQSLKVTLREQDDCTVNFTTTQKQPTDSFSIKGASSGKRRKVVGFASANATTMTVTTQLTTTTTEPSLPPPNNLSSVGLCAIAKQESIACTENLGLLSNTDPKRDYEVHRLAQTELIERSMSVAQLLSKDRPHSLLRTERLSLTLALASSFLQYFSTSWLPGVVTAEEIRIPIDQKTGSIEHMRPFVMATFGTAPSCRSGDSAFQELAIVLLELCFGHVLAEHPMWKQDSLLSTTHPLMRKAVASEWYRDVKFEAGQDFATAVEWCLHKASLKDPDWRVEFAQHVVQPLQTCYEAAVGGTSSCRA